MKFYTLYIVVTITTQYYLLTTAMLVLSLHMRNKQQIQLQTV